MNTIIHEGCHKPWVIRGAGVMSRRHPVRVRSMEGSAGHGEVRENRKTNRLILLLVILFMEVVFIHFQQMRSLEERLNGTGSQLQELIHDVRDLNGAPMDDWRGEPMGVEPDFHSFEKQKDGKGVITL